jgi:antitoxin CptB
MIDQARLNRIRWRARRGLLENDIVLEKYFSQHEASFTEESIAGLDALLDLSDNELLDVVMQRVELADVPTAQMLPAPLRQQAQEVLTVLRAI